MEKTIAAVATGNAAGGIGVIRISGEKAIEIADKVFKAADGSSLLNLDGYRAKFGNIVSDGRMLDNAVALVFRAPKSYTGENVCELSVHGGLFIIEKTLEAVLNAGAVPAEPGEFTKRAFLNGRIDLLQAESVIDVINAKSEREAKTGIKQLEGFLSKEIADIKQQIMNVMINIEVAIDYPEYDVDDVTTNQIKEMLENTEIKLKKLEKSFDNGKIIKEGIKTAIIGRPNAGKSSLLNAILKENRAIVTEYEGTTRDTIEEFVNINGIPLKLIDTAGIRETSDEVEKIGVAKSREIAETADLVIAIFDSSKDLTEEDMEILELAKSKKSVIIGIEKLYDEITNLFNLNQINVDNEIVITNIRHKNLITKAIESVKKTKETIENQMPLDIIAIFIKDILEDLGNITGEVVTENIIDEIFAKFCLGK